MSPTKAREGFKVHKTYHTPRPPLSRVVDTGVLTAETRVRLKTQTAAINPLAQPCAESYTGSST